VTAPQNQGAESGVTKDVAKIMALIAATLYGELLDVPIPSNRAARFTPDQAFALVQTMFYQAIKDEELI
jgi:hypothetical protein